MTQSTNNVGIKKKKKKATWNQREPIPISYTTTKSEQRNSFTTYILIWPMLKTNVRLRLLYSKDIA